MVERSQFQYWYCSPQDLSDLTPVRVRDLIITCFFHAQKETFARAKKNLGQETSDDAIRDSVTQAVRLACKQTGMDFDHPTKAGLEQVVQVLAKKASAWGTPGDIVEHHGRQIMHVIEKI